MGKFVKLPMVFGRELRLRDIKVIYPLGDNSYDVSVGGEDAWQIPLSADEVERLIAEAEAK